MLQGCLEVLEAVRSGSLAAAMTILDVVEPYLDRKPSPLIRVPLVAIEMTMVAPLCLIAIGAAVTHEVCRPLK